MQRRKKILVWLSAVPGALLVFALTLQIVLPRIINLESVKNEIQTTLSKELGGNVTVGRIQLSILPRPRVHAGLLRISIPGMLEGSVDSLSVYPRILPLFTGKLRVAQITADAPDFIVRLPEKPVQKKKAKAPDTLAAVKEAITAAGARLASMQPSLAVVIQRGRMAVSQGRRPQLIAEDVDARVVFPPRGFIVNLDCRTTFWENLTIKARLDPQAFTAAGSIEVEALKPHLLGPYLFPHGTSPVGDSLVDLDLSFTTDGVRKLQARVKGAAPYLRLLRNRKTLLIEDAQFTGSVELDEQKTAITLDGLEAASPRLALKGEMQSDAATPRAGLTVTGSDIDIQALRRAALFLAPDDPTVQSIFDILRAGTIPAITFQSSGKTPSDLGNLKRMRITAALQQGTLDIPGTPLHLTNAGGNAVISGGILHGDQLTARLGNTAAQNGTLRLGLQGGDAPFHLDIMVKADFAELPPVLKAFITDQSFLRELGLLRDVQGDAQGRLILGESTRSINVTTDISSFELDATYQRVPFPIRISGGRFFFDGKKILLEQISAVFGKSFLTGLSARLNLTAPSSLEITSAQSSLVLDEMYPWLSSFPAIKQALQGIETVHGTALLSIRNASFPLAKPGTVRFTAAGSVKNLSIGSKNFPGPLTIAQAGFKADRETISFTNADADLLDASLNISGRMDGYLRTMRGGAFTITGTLGEEAVHWLAQEFSLPPEFAVRPPISISQTRLAWQGKDTLACSGTFTFRKGPSVTLDIVRDPRKLAINDLSIQDGNSRADIKLKVEKKTLDLAVSGTLQAKTLKKILANEHLHHGRLSGNFQAHVPLDRPRQSTAHGTFEGEQLLLPLGLKIPTKIDRISLKADGSRITVGPADISFGDTHLDFSGTVTASSEGYLVDGALSADKVAADTIGAALGKKGDADGQAKKKPPKSTWNLPLQGTVRFSAGSVNYGRLSASPVHADITVSSNSIRAAVSEAVFCGISLPGTVTVTPKDISLDFSPLAEKQDLESTFACLGEGKRATGTFSVKGRLMARGTAKTLLQSLQGKVEYTARDGLIYSDAVVVKVLSFLSVNELLRGKLPDPTVQGIPFRTIVVRGTIMLGVLNLKEYSVDGPVVDVAGQGNVDFVNETTDLTVIVAPLSITTDIVKKIPGVNYILHGTLVTFPLHLQGPFGDVKVSYNPVTAVGKGIFGIMKRIVQIPLKPFEPSEVKEEDKIFHTIEKTIEHPVESVEPKSGEQKP